MTNITKADQARQQTKTDLEAAIKNLERELKKLGTGVRKGSDSCDEVMIEYQIEKLRGIFGPE